MRGGALLSQGSSAACRIRPSKTAESAHTAPSPKAWCSAVFERGAAYSCAGPSTVRPPEGRHSAMRPGAPKGAAGAHRSPTPKGLRPHIPGGYTNAANQKPGPAEELSHSPKGDCATDRLPERSRPPQGTVPSCPLRPLQTPKRTKHGAADSDVLALGAGCRSGHCVNTSARGPSPKRRSVRRSQRHAPPKRFVSLAPKTPVSPVVRKTCAPTAEAVGAWVPRTSGEFDRAPPPPCSPKRTRQVGTATGLPGREWLVGTRLDAPASPPRMETLHIDASTGSSNGSPPRKRGGEHGDAPLGLPKRTSKLGRSPELSFPFSAWSMREM